MTHLEAGADPGPPTDIPVSPKQARIPRGALHLVRATCVITEQAEAWAAAEGWQHSGHAAAVFERVRPGGHFAGFLGERHVSTIRIVNYSDDFAFCGMLLVDPQMRRRGIAAATWEAAIGYAGSRTLAADVAPELREKAEKQGFGFRFRIFRFAGPIPTPRLKDPHVVPFDATLHSEQIAALDAACSPAARPGFAATFATANGHHTMVYADANGTVQGYGVLRPTRGTARIGPLYAERSYQAAAIFDHLCGLAAQAGAVKVGLDVPSLSQAGRAIAETRGLSRIGYVYRGYRPGAVDLQPVDFDRLCALTCLGMG